MRRRTQTLYYFSCLESQGTFHLRTRQLLQNLTLESRVRTMRSPRSRNRCFCVPRPRSRNLGLPDLLCSQCRRSQEIHLAWLGNSGGCTDAGGGLQELRSGPTSWRKKRRSIRGGCSVVPTDKTTPGLLKFCKKLRDYFDVRM